MRKIFQILTCLLLTNNLVAEKVTPRIIARVDKSIITSHDLNSRTRLFFLLAGIKDTPQNRKRISPHILKKLVQEEVKRNEFKRHKAAVAKEEIDQAVAGFAGQYQMTLEQFDNYLKSQKINPRTFRKQTEVDLLWQKYVMSVCSDKATIGEAEIDQYITQHTNLEDVEKYRINEITLYVSSPQEAEAVKKQANELLTLIKEGANFEAVALQFSQSSSSKAGGNIGWVSQASLSPNEKRALKNVTPQQTTVLAKINGGYRILRLSGKLEKGVKLPEFSMYKFLQMLIPMYLVNDESFNEDINSAASMGELQKVLQNYPEVLSEIKENVFIMNAPPAIQMLLAQSTRGAITPPLSTPDGALRLYVASIKDAPKEYTSRLAHQILYAKKMSALADKKLDELVQKALIDIVDKSYNIRF